MTGIAPAPARRKARALAALAAGLWLGGCVVGPAYRAPPAPVTPTAQAFAGGPAIQGSPSAGEVTPLSPPDAWWRLYGDPAIDALVARALVANTDLRVAAANLEEARALLSEARVARFPATALTASATRNRAQVAIGLPAVEYDLFDAGLAASYEIDLFGRVTRMIEAARADRAAAEAARDFTAVTVAAGVVRAYVEACASAERAAIATRTLGWQDQTVALTRRRLTAGRGDRLDLARATSLADQTRATIPPLLAERSSALARLSVLTGVPPFEVIAGAERCARTPLIATPLPVGDGLALVRRRPDIRQAERRLAGETARIGVATADLYPTITLGGTVGTTSTTVGGLTDSNAFRYSVGPLLTWSFPNIGVARARVRQAKARTAAALASFDGVVLTALEDTQSALAAYVRERDRLQALTASRDSAAEAAKLSRLRFTRGADDFLTQLDAERTLGEAELALAESAAEVAADQVTLFQALGGGWEGASAATRP